MLRSVALKTLRDTRRALAWWGAGLVGLAALIVSVFPSVRDNPGLQKLVDDYPEAMKGFISFGAELDYTSAAGYLGSELFSFMVPLLLIVASVGAGARALAGEEEAGTLELLLANPLSRRRLVLEKLAALLVEVTLLAAVLWLALLVGTALLDMDVTAAHLGAATSSVAVLALGFGAIAMLVGAATGRRGLAIGLAAAAAVAAYLLNSLAPLVDALEPVRRASPFYHYAAADPLRHGLAFGHAMVLIAIAAVAAALALVAFDRRDLGT